MAPTRLARREGSSIGHFLLPIKQKSFYYLGSVWSIIRPGIRRSAAQLTFCVVRREHSRFDLSDWSNPSNRSIPLTTYLPETIYEKKTLITRDSKAN